MNIVDEKEYFSMIDNVEILGFHTLKIINILTPENEKFYFSFLNNSHVMEKYVNKADHKEDINKKRVTAKDESVLNIYMKIAQKDFNDIFKVDDGLLFKMYFQKMIPLTNDVILGWANEEMSKSATLTNEVSKVVQNYRDLKAYDILQKILSDVRGKPSLWQKIKGEELKFNQSQLTLSLVKEKLKNISDQAEKLLEEASKNENKITLMFDCISIVSKCAEDENKNDGMYRYLYSRKDTIFSAVLQAKVLPVNLKGLIEEITTVYIKIDETMLVTIPTIELARANSV